MNVRIKFFGEIQSLFPGYNREEGLIVDIPENMTAGGLLTHLKIPDNMGAIVFAGSRLLKISDGLMNDSEILIMQPLHNG